MKKLTIVLLSMLMALSLFACSNTSTNNTDPSSDNKLEVNLSSYPFVGTWTDDDSSIYWRIYEDGSLISESIIVNTSTLH